MHSPADEFAVDEVPLESLHVEDVQVQRVRLHAVELAVGRADLGLPLVEVGLRAGLAVELLYLVALHVKEVAVVRLLVRGREAPEDQDVLIRDLEEAAALEADPVCVFLYLKVQGLPLLSAFEVKFLYQVRPLPTVKACNDVKGGAVESDGGMEVSLGVQTGDLCPLILGDVIHLTLVHGFVRQRGPDCEYLTLFPLN